MIPWQTSTSIMRRIVREPLFHFIAAGLLLFAAARVYRAETDTYRIVITPAHVAQLVNEYALKFGAPPDAETLDGLVREDIHNEILYREGLLLKLDRDDEIVRRRTVQKMQFLMQDLSTPTEPDAHQLAAWYESHARKYVTPARVTFSHIYFSSDGRGDAAARARASEVLATLSSTVHRAPDRGDAFPDLYDFSAYEPEQVKRLFGNSPFTDAVFDAPVGEWAGPYKSGYGWHLLYIDARQAPERLPLAAVSALVRADYLDDARDKANRQAFDKLARRFTVIREDEAATP